jgi:hypothetical protein
MGAWKHLILEHVRLEHVHEFETHAYELWRHMADRGWVPYHAHVARGSEHVVPSLFDIGVLRTAEPLDTVLIVFEAEFATRADVEAQLAAMREDRDVARITLAASRCVVAGASRSYLTEAFAPSPRARDEVEQRRHR